ncbi:MAG TPA: EscU/YscU/HrcU family type III secretion system export apparatus switch protein [Devosiaceae bacterium]|jgi:type III secretion system FlhB-like substrate exporter|nr:EscU/YscU/HrcU family type III secretion system export apparatus switch protein [Devosiaceae bacterium]
MTDEAKPRKLAVALEYERGSREAPRVTAKGYGLVADAIIALAGENDIVIDADPVLAEALSGLDLDQTVPVELFEAVAEVIGFVLRTRDQMQASSGGVVADAEPQL